jgi:hypothetical protein
MQFESKNKRNFWINSIFGMTPDVLVAAAITAYNSEGFVTFLLVFLGLQIVYLLIWIKNTVWAWVFYKYKGRKQVSDFFFDYLKKNKYPEPDDYLKSPNEYFSSVAQNNSLPLELRLKAATDIGSLFYPIANGQMQNSIRLSMAIEDAIENYKKTFDA